MAYIDNTTITVDAVLTRRGRELLAKNGNLNITLVMNAQPAEY